MLPVVRWMLSACLAVAGAGKLFGGYDSAFVVPAWAFHAVAVFELILAAALLRRHDRLAAVGVLVLAAIGVGIALVAPDARCGCMGRLIELHWRHHMVFCGTIGTLASVLLLLTTDQPMTVVP